MRDADIRAALHADELAHFDADPHTRVVSELGLCQGASRVDIAIVNGRLHGYEIKSERDTLERLPSQMEAYNRVFDRMTIVTGVTHVVKIAQLVPDWWGVIVAEGGRANGVQLRSIRESAPNPTVDAYALAQLLWKDEALAILHDNGGTRGLKGKPRDALWQALADRLPTDVLGHHVRETLKNRPDWR